MATDEPATERSARGRLPSPTTSIIGREAETTAALDLLWDPGTRLVSLLGPGGVGKTRLALEIARRAEAGPAFADGVRFAELSALTRPELLASEIAGAAGLADGAASVDDLAAALEGADLLVVLDNFEHVVAAAADVARLLAATRRLSVLVTSRRPLGLAGEHRMTIAPLDAGAAAELFGVRARAARHDVAFDERDVAIIASICERVDRLPLAIELAAARIRVLSPAVLHERLARDLRLLDAGPLDRPDRLRSMGAAVRWSLDGLAPHERRVLALLSVFVGGWDLPTAASVCALSDDETIDVTTALLDHHLIQRVDTAGDPRFAMFDTVRDQLAEERALADPEVDRRHALAFRALAETAAPRLEEAEQVRWLDRLAVEHDNLRAALQWSLTHEPAIALHIVNALRRYWTLRGHLREGLDWAERALASVGGDEHDGRVDPAIRAGVSIGAGVMHEAVGDDTAARARYVEALAAYERVGDLGAQATAVRHVGNAELGMARYDDAAEHFDRSRRLAEEIGDGFARAAAICGAGTVAYYRGQLDEAEQRWSEAAAWFRVRGVDAYVATMLNNLAELAAARDRPAAAVPLHEETLEIRHRLGDPLGTAQTLVNLGGALCASREIARARVVLEDALRTLRDLGVARDIATCAYHLALVARAERRLDDALELARESLRTKRVTNEPFDMAQCLELVAALAVDVGRPADAARLVGAAGALRRRIGARPLTDEPGGGDVVARLDTALGPHRAQELMGEGEPWTLDESVAAAFGILAPARGAELTAASPHPPPARPSPAALKLGLTGRELEVLGFLVQRYSDREIADALVISLRTVTTHVSRILTKLGVEGRRQAAAEAVRLELVAS